MSLNRTIDALIRAIQESNALAALLLDGDLPLETSHDHEVMDRLGQGRGAFGVVAVIRAVDAGAIQDLPAARRRLPRACHCGTAVCGKTGSVHRQRTGPGDSDVT